MLSSASSPSKKASSAEPESAALFVPQKTRWASRPDIRTYAASDLLGPDGAQEILLTKVAERDRLADELNRNLLIDTDNGAITLTGPSLSHGEAADAFERNGRASVRARIFLPRH